MYILHSRRTQFLQHQTLSLVWLHLGHLVISPTVRCNTGLRFNSTNFIQTHFGQKKSHLGKEKRNRPQDLRWKRPMVMTHIQKPNHNLWPCHELVMCLPTCNKRVECITNGRRYTTEILNGVWPRKNRASHQLPDGIMFKKVIAYNWHNLYNTFMPWWFPSRRLSVSDNWPKQRQTHWRQRIYMRIFKAQGGHLFSAAFVLFYNETTCSEIPTAGLLAGKINESEVKNNREH